MEVLHFFLRWIHLLAGITWIGILYYFNFVQTPFFATWLIQTSGQGPPERTEVFDHRRFDNITAKDRRLLQDALDLGCDAFMTMERRRVAVGVVTITRTRSRLGA